MRFATVVFVRMCIAAPIAFLVLMNLVWLMDRVFGATDTVLERIHRTEQAAAERDLWDRLAVGPCEWLP